MVFVFPTLFVLTIKFFFFFFLVNVLTINFSSWKFPNIRAADWTQRTAVFVLLDLLVGSAGPQVSGDHARFCTVKVIDASSSDNLLARVLVKSKFFSYTHICIYYTYLYVYICTYTYAYRQYVWKSWDPSLSLEFMVPILQKENGLVLSMWSREIFSHLILWIWKLKSCLESEFM